VTQVEVDINTIIETKRQKVMMHLDQFSLNGSPSFNDFLQSSALLLSFYIFMHELTWRNWGTLSPKNRNSAIKSGDNGTK
jgi:hypothetical protein